MAMVIGIDIGSARSKGILLSGGKTLAFVNGPSGGDFRRTAEEIRQALLDQTGTRITDIARIVATGFGAKRVDFADDTKLDLLCHAKAVSLLLPGVRTVIDVGDLSTKVFRTDGQGGLHNFLLSGKCAGGSGRILQVIAKVLRVKIEEIGELSLRSKRRVEFQTGCAVFAESEVISRIAEGVAKEDLLAGLHRALAGQINSLVERIGIEMDMAMVGGGARDIGLVHALQEIRGHEVRVPPDPHMTGALGAAWLAMEALGS
jgi:predicted CoA-substrate-specific enzyme activase